MKRLVKKYAYELASVPAILFLLFVSAGIHSWLFDTTLQEALRRYVIVSIVVLGAALIAAILFYVVVAIVDKPPDDF